MTFRIGWLSPLTPASGVGTFSHAVTKRFPAFHDGEAIDLTLLHPGHLKMYQSGHRTIQIEESEHFHRVLSLFDLLIYNIGNNREHHDAIIALLRIHPGVVICHDYVYQHYLAERSLRSGNGFASYAALLTSYGDRGAQDYIKRSRITSRTGKARYCPWDSECSSSQPMSDSIFALGSALVVHSAFTRRYAEARFHGPILQLGMPFDQKPTDDLDGHRSWQRQLIVKRTFNLMSFGYIQPTKCIELVLGAIGSSSALRRRVRYTVAGYLGEGDYIRRLRDLVSTLALDDIVTFELNVSDARLGELASEADVFVNLRKPNTEGSSASLIEQLVGGKPVLVLDSGCYAEIPPGAAVVLPADAGCEDIRDALQTMIDKPERMLAIGRAGRDYARSWSCASYADGLINFLVSNRGLLQDRSKVVGIRSSSAEARPEDAWQTDLGRARRSLRYLDCNMLALDPAIVNAKSADDLCRFVAHVIFGLFGNERLLRSLDRYFAGLGKHAAYWSCVRLALVADAVFGNDPSAQQRLQALGPYYVPEFWAVIEHFPTRYAVAAGSLILLGRMPEEGDLCGLPMDDADRSPKRWRLAELLRSDATAADAPALCLQRWLEQSEPFDSFQNLPVLDEEVDWGVGYDNFRTGTDLSGFHDIEPDLVWTRGRRAFIGLRLGSKGGRVELLVRHVDASPSHPCEITFGAGNIEAKVQVKSLEPIWIAFDVPPNRRDTVATTWLRLSTNRAARPPKSQDARVLGVGLMRLHFAPRSERTLQFVGPSMLAVHVDAAA